MNVQELEAEVARLTSEIDGERIRNAALQGQVEAMKSQQLAMAALFRGAQPTPQGRIDHARATTDH